MKRIGLDASRRPLVALVAIAVLAIAGAAVVLERATAGGVPKDLGGEARYLGHLATDKPLYRPGETVYARALLLHAFSRAPLAGAHSVEFVVESPKGERVTAGWGAVENGVGAFHWEIPKEQVGGTYRIVTHFPSGYPDAEVELDVRAYRAPRLNTEIEFVRDGYGPGDTVTAAFVATRAEGGVPAGAKVTAIATVDGAEIHRAPLTLDAEGGLTVKFTLPKKIEDGRGTLVLVVEDGGVRETATKTIPIVVASVDLALYAEGGDLVAGLPTRLYMEGRNKIGEPADIAGRIVTKDGEAVATFRTEHEGRGRVAFTPKAGTTYEVAIDEPAGVTKRYPLPAVKAEGYTIASGADVHGAGEPVVLQIGANVTAEVKWIPTRLVLAQRERVVAEVKLALKPGETRAVSLTPPATADGVLRATIFDADDKPRAERLVFRRADRALNIAVTVAPERTTPRGKITLTVETTDGRGEPLAATVGLSVVDDSVLEKIEKRDRRPRLPVQVFLGSDVNELADAHVYLSDEEGAPAALDLLLGTQGWRRFAFSAPDAFIAAHGEHAKRALALFTRPEPVDARGFGGGGAGGGDFDDEMMDGGAMEGAPMPDAVPPPMPMAPGADPADAPDRPAENAEPVQPAPAVEEEREADRDDDGDRNAPDEQPMAEPEPEVLERAKKEFEGARAPARKPMPMDGLRAERKRVAGRRAQLAQQIAWKRVYAHQASQSPGGQRLDFSETLYWNAGLATDPKTGKATVTFDAADSITTFRVLADGFAAAGELGSSDATFEVRKPFFIEPKLPFEVTAGDTVGVPVALINGTNEDMDVALRFESGAPFAIGETPETKRLLAEERGLVSVPVTVGAANETVMFRVVGEAGPFRDDILRTVKVVPRGFPIEEAFGGQLAGSTKHGIVIPEKVDPTSIVTEAVVYPSPLASLTEALAALLREPYGCFEQTSSSAYPNVMVLDYVNSHQGVDPAVVKRANELLDKGYKRLVGFECSEKGYEWFGGDPGHEALSAYGLMEFTDMGEVGYQVDPEMLERTRKWLLSRRDGKGGFQRNARALDSFGGAPDDITNAYIIWSLTESGVDAKTLEKEIEAIRTQAATSKDAYYLGLAANILVNVGDADGAAKVGAKLSEHQTKEGVVDGAKTSITRSGGDGLRIETTSLAILAWLRIPEQTARCEKAMHWMMERCKAGRFGSTQSTVMALKAINAYDAARAAPKKDGAILVVVDGKVFDERAFTKDQEGAITLPSFAEKLTPGKHEIELRMVDGSPMPFSLVVRYHSDQPASSEECTVAIETSLAKAKVTEGETVELTTKITNRKDEGAPMTVAIIGLPGGLEPRVKQLKEHVKAGLIGAFELRGREVILYWRALAPKAEKVVHLDLVAAIPGSYTGPASRAYLYYTDEHKIWTAGLEATIEPR